MCYDRGTFNLGARCLTDRRPRRRRWGLDRRGWRRGGGAVVGGPVGAAVGGVAGGVIGGVASGPGPVVVAPAPVVPAAPCSTRTTTTQDNNTGASVTRQTTDCPN